MKPIKQFLVASLIEKLSPSWNEFMSYLKLKTKEMGFEDLIIKLQIQEDNKKAISKGKQPMKAKANLVDSKGNTNKKCKFQRDGKSQPMERFKGNYYHCGNHGHVIKECHKLKREQKGQEQRQGQG
ncbi:hypothetical protein RND71_035409 [Anisodus tanguticus]|uniref:CCHC-type domain-containing protein n=1 Tax=Anisodus tanguticus TaxID=243964 RepID=A0AAE1UUF7_9SOLA|nr:hypothetical protein RND71_035409 [Anisodus tanguticus]